MDARNPVAEGRVDQEPDIVMVIPLDTNRCDEPPGFLSEDHVISHSRHVTGNRVVRMNLANLPGEDDETGERSFTTSPALA